MSLPAGTRLGPYEVVEVIGAGGMGEVYRARDTRLGRDVALKVLPPAFAADPERRARFEREAQTVAALSHPHIVSLFDTGVHGGQIFVVMELLDGETLRARLTTSALPIRKSIEIAVQVARGLAAAHDKGLVHRDLKPDNIFLLVDGHVKILDFGLARAAGGENAGSGATETVAALTDPGLVMGTIGYMAPEQVRGRAVDSRADLFAFGAVLYEMLTGARAFQRETPADTMTAILKEDPPELTALRSDLPPALDRIIRHCLEKNPAERFQSARDVAFALEALSGSAAATTAMPAPSGSIERVRRRPGVREGAAWVLAAAGIAAATFIAASRPAAPADPAAVRFSLPIAGSETSLSSSVAVSPDGRTMVIWVNIARDTRLRLRHLGALDDVLLPGTEGGAAAFWSPDSQSIGFIADRTLKRFDLATSSVRSIAPLGQTFGAPAWGADGSILLSVPGLGVPLHRVPDGGGSPASIGELDKSVTEVGQVRPVFLPDGRRYFFHSIRGAALTQVPVLASLDSGRRTVLDHPGTRIVWAGEDRLVFRRADALYAQRVTYEPLALVGEAVQIVPDVDGAPNLATIREGGSAGVIAYAERSSRQQQFRWYGRDGRLTGTVGDGGSYSTFDLSKDGRRIVTNRRSPSGSNLWLIDAETGSSARITAGQFSDVDPRWSTDGSAVIFGSSRDFARGPHKVGLAADTPAPVWKFDGRMYSGDDWSRDGRWLLYHDAAAPVLQARELDASGATKGEPVVVARALTGTMDQARMSPDGKWVAYNSNETGRFEVYVVPFPANGQRFPVSRNGGSQPTWRADGSELYYLSPDGVLNAVKVTASGTTFATGEPVQIIRPKLAGVSSVVEQYVPHPSGTKFLFLDTVGDETSLSIGVLLNWASLLSR